MAVTYRILADVNTKNNPSIAVGSTERSDGPREGRGAFELYAAGTLGDLVSEGWKVEHMSAIDATWTRFLLRRDAALADEASS